MATTNTIKDILDARNIALIRGDIDAVNLLNKTLSGFGQTSQTDGGIPTSSPNSSNGASTNEALLGTNVVDLNDLSKFNNSTLLPSVNQLGNLLNAGAVNSGPLSNTLTNESLIGLNESPTIPSQNVGCNYRYSFGCPVFSKYISDAGCRILVPVYRTCYLDVLNSNTSLMPSSELVGNIEITAYGDQLLRVQENYINQNGVSGKRTVDGTKLTSAGLRLAIEELSGIKSAINWVQSSDGIYRNTSSNLSIETIVSNLESITSSTSGPLKLKGTVAEWAQYISAHCDLSKQPLYCITSETFTPNTDASSNTPSTGKFCNNVAGKVAVPNTRQLIRQDTRPIDNDQTSNQFVPIPNKPCAVGLQRRVQAVQIYSEDYAYPCYLNSDYSGSIIGYDLVETRETTVFGEIYPIYVSERPDPNCSYSEYEREYDEDDPANPCLGIIKKDVIRKYEDGRQEIFAKGVFVRYYRKMDADCSPETIKVYHPLDLGTDVISGKVRANTKGLFNLSQSLQCYNTSSLQSTDSKKYYYQVTDCNACGRTPYFALAYGHAYGSGSLYVSGDQSDTPTKAVHSQYRLLALESNETRFTFYTNGIATQSKDVYVINYYRDGLSDRLDPGNFELNFAKLAGNSFANSLFTGSNVTVSGSNEVLRFIDNSSDYDESTSCVHDPYVSYDIVSGSLTNGIYVNTTQHTYGTVYPNLGIIVLDPYKFNAEMGFNTTTGSNIDGDNAMKLFKSISGSGVIGNYMKARNVKYKTTNHYFVRAAAPLANYSNNPTFVSGSDGYLFHPCFEDNAQTYITTVGLYNDFNELLAVAKMSQPINKSFDNDVLIKIRLNW